MRVGLFNQILTVQNVVGMTRNAIGGKNSQDEYTDIQTIKASVIQMSSNVLGGGSDRESILYQVQCRDFESFNVDNLVLNQDTRFKWGGSILAVVTWNRADSYLDITVKQLS